MGDAGEGAQTVQQMRDRMAAIKEQVAAEVDAKWGSPWRTPAVFDLKVNARLTGHEEYRSLRDRIQEAERQSSEADESN